MRNQLLQNKVRVERMVGAGDAVSFGDFTSGGMLSCLMVRANW